MMRFEYKVVPAPTRGQKGKGVKGNDGKFANALEVLMNDMGAQGWEYQRAETLPSEERSGLTSKTNVFRNVLVFRRGLETDVDAFEPILLDTPDDDAIQTTVSADDTADESQVESASEILDETSDHQDK